MNLSKNRSTVSETQQNTTSKGTTLNPHAAEFIPSALRVTPGTTSTTDAVPNVPASGSLRKQVLDRSESSVSANSDEEAHQYWQCQLPDDITPDFKILGEESSEVARSLSLAGLSLHEGGDANSFSAAMPSGYLLNEQLDLAPHHANGSAFAGKIRYPLTSHEGGSSRANSFHMPAKPWEKHAVNSDHLLVNGSFEENITHVFPDDMVNENALLENSDMNPLEFLASQFPGFAADSLAEIYFANCCNLHLTVEMLTQLELQVDGGFNLNPNAKVLSAPNLSAMDFPALSVPHKKMSVPKYTGDDVQQTANSCRYPDKDNMLLFKSSSSLPPRGSIDFASAVRKLAFQDSGLWKYDRNGSVDASVGSSRSSHVLASSFSSGPADRLQSHRPGRAAPVWLETGEAVANMYSELREEARDEARLRNAYFEQARQAYLIGNKALAKELSVKGQRHNMQMKAAHNKAQESIYHHRNPVTADSLGGGRGQERMIDLHGLHVSEAIHVLKYELAALRSTARSSEQRLQLYICVGTGHHTRGSRTPARLPIAVQRYLLEEEALEYTEPQPGLLCVVIY
ncbi:hypothetical protein Ancab_022585 [Ancistrocladus abbreviatus]